MNGIVKEMIKKTKSAMTAVVSNPENYELQKTLYHYEEFAGCICVKSVEAPTLAETTAVLVRGLNERNERTKRHIPFKSGGRGQVFGWSMPDRLQVQRVDHAQICCSSQENSRSKQNSS